MGHPDQTRHPDKKIEARYKDKEKTFGPDKIPRHKDKNKTPRHKDRYKTSRHTVEHPDQTDKTTRHKDKDNTTRHRNTDKYTNTDKTPRYINTNTDSVQTRQARHPEILGKQEATFGSS